MKKEDLIWLAGFFDGDGSIFIEIFSGKYLRYDLKIAIGQSGKLGKLLCKQLKFNFKGNTYEETRKNYKKNFYVWRCRGLRAHKVLCQILSYLKIKKEQANLGIEFWEIHSSRKYNYLSDSEKIIKFCYGETIKQEISFLNTKG